MKDKIIEILKSKIRIKSTVMTDYCDPHIKSDITGFEEAAQELSSLLKGEGEYKNDIIQFVTNALYRAHDEDMKTLSSIEFDKWIEAQTEALEKYLQPVSLPDKELTVEIIKYNATSYADEKKALIPNFTDYEWSQSFIDYSRGFCDGFGMTMNNNIPDKDAIIQKQNEYIKHLEWFLANIKVRLHDIIGDNIANKEFIELRDKQIRLESELANLKNQQP